MVDYSIIIWFKEIMTYDSDKGYRDLQALPALKWYDPDLEEARALVRAHRDKEGWDDAEWWEASRVEGNLQIRIRGVLRILPRVDACRVLEKISQYTGGWCELHDLLSVLRSVPLPRDHVDCMLSLISHARYLSRALPSVGRQDS